MLPSDVRSVISVDLERLRGQPGWTTVLTALSKNTTPFLDGFAAATGLNLTKQIRHVLVALPDERQSDDRFVLIADADQLDETRLSAWLYAHLGSRTSAFVRGGNQIVISQGRWTQEVAALVTSPRLSPSASSHPDFLRLCTRAATDHNLWFAAIVPMTVRRALMQAPVREDAASIMRVSGAIDITRGAHIEVVGELASTADAMALVHRLGVYRNQAKRHPDMLVLGLAPYLEALSLSMRNARVYAAIDLSSAQLSETIERIEALAHEPGTK